MRDLVTTEERVFLGDLVVDLRDPKSSFVVGLIPNSTCPQGSVGIGSCPLFIIASDTGENSEGEISLLTKGAFNVICRPPLHAGEVIAVQLPASMAAVGSRQTADSPCRLFWCPGSHRRKRAYS